MHNHRVMMSAVILLIYVISAGCTSTTPIPAATVTPAPVPAAYQPQSSVPSGLTIGVDSLGAGSVLPDACTCKGASESPEVAWDGIPSGTKSLVLILDDPDAQAGRFTHWIVFNIPPVPGKLERGQPNVKVLANGAQ